jgi:hypothetical protein
LLVGQTPRGDPVGDHPAQRGFVEDARIGDHLPLVGVCVDVRTDDVEFGGATRDRLDRLVAMGFQQMRDEVVKELLVTLFVAGDPAR